MSQRLRQQGQQVEEIEEDEHEEVFVVTVAETVVDEWTVMVESLNTLVADRAMEGALGFDYLTV